MPNVDDEHVNAVFPDFVDDAKVSAPGGPARVVGRCQLLPYSVGVLRQRSMDEFVASGRNRLRQLFSQRSSRLAGELNSEGH